MQSDRQRNCGRQGGLGEDKKRGLLPRRQGICFVWIMCLVKAEDRRKTPGSRSRARFKWFESSAGCTVVKSGGEDRAMLWKQTRPGHFTSVARQKSSSVPRVEGGRCHSWVSGRQISNHWVGETWGARFRDDFQSVKGVAGSESKSWRRNHQLSLSQHALLIKWIPSPAEKIRYLSKIFLKDWGVANTLENFHTSSFGGKPPSREVR